MNLVSQASVARGLQLSRPAIGEAVKRGVLRKVKGYIDLDCELTKLYISKVEARKGITFTHPKLTQPKPTPKPPRKKRNRVPAEVSKPTQLAQITSDSSRLGDPTLDRSPDEIVLDRAELERLKIAESVIKMRTETMAKRKELVSRDLNQTVFAKLAAVDTSELHPLGDSISGDLAAAFGLDDNEARVKAKAIVDKRVFRALKHRKRIMEDWIKKIGTK